MKKLLCTFLFTLFCLSSSGYAKNFEFSGLEQHLYLLSSQVDQLHEGSDEIKAIKKYLLILEKNFIAKLERKYQKKIDNNKEKLEDYKRSLEKRNEEDMDEESSDFDFDYYRGVDPEIIARKIKSCEEQLEHCREILNILEPLKQKLAEKE